MLKFKNLKKSSYRYSLYLLINIIYHQLNEIKIKHIIFIFFKLFQQYKLILKFRNLKKLILLFSILSSWFQNSRRKILFCFDVGSHCEFLFWTCNETIFSNIYHMYLCVLIHYLIMNPDLYFSFGPASYKYF